MRQPDSRLKEILTHVLTGVSALVVCYIVYYWILWRGGQFVWTQYLSPLISSAPTPASSAASSTSSSTTFEILKLIWAVVGAVIGGIAAAFVRRWFIFAALKGKIELLDKVRAHIVLLLTKPAQNSTDIAISAGSIKFLFGEKEYVNIGKYIEPAIALQILRAISSLDMLSAMAKTPTWEADIARSSKSLIQELSCFDLKQVLESIEPLSLNPKGATEDATEKAGS